MENEKNFDLDPDDVAKDVVFEGQEAESDAEGKPASPLDSDAITFEGTEGKKEEGCSFDEYKQVLDEHFQKLRALIKYTKTKDETIQKLSGELQKYREDYCAKTFKSVAILLISYREDCRRSLFELGTFDLSLEKVKKYLGYLCDDFEELLSNAGCEWEDGVWNFNGMSLNHPVEEIRFPELFQTTIAEEDSKTCVCGESIKEYLQNTEDEIKKILSDNEALDKCLKDYCMLATSIESNLVALCVYPSIRKMVALFEKMKQKLEESNAVSDEAEIKSCYRDSLEFMIKQIEEVLLSGGIQIDTPLDDSFDTKKNRLVKTIVTEDASLDRKIVKQHTECYLMNDTVIYPSKVDVYKYQAAQA